MKLPRMIVSGVIVAGIIGLAVPGALWGLGQMASANSGSVVLVHLNPDGSDYTGNPYCPQGGVPVDDDADTEVDRWLDDCNNVVTQYHVIRTQGLGTLTPGSFNLEGVGVILVEGYCDELPEVTSRPLWNPANDNEACVVVHSSVPGETRVTFTYDDPTIPEEYVTEAVIKEWDSLLDTVILKSDPADMDGDTVIDADDHHAADEQGTWEDDAVVWDEGWKRVRSYPPVKLIEIVHGGHEVLVDHETVDLHQPTQGAIIKAWIESDHGCTYFTTPTGTYPDDPALYMSFGTMMNGISNGEGRFVGPQVVPDITMPTGLQILQIDNDGDTVVNEDPVDGVDNDGDTLTDEDGPDSNNGLMDPEGNYDYDSIYVDTTCEEQAIIHILVGYPDSPGSLKVPVEEWIGINWVTMEEAKQPQIRWAGEEIVLEKRWALPDEFYPNDNCGPDEDQLCPVCPLAGYVVQYNREEPSPGGLEQGIPNLNALNAPDSVWTIIGPDCISRAMYGSDDQGQVNVEALVWSFDGSWAGEAAGLQDEMNTCIDEFNNTGDAEVLEDCLAYLEDGWYAYLEEGLVSGDLTDIFNRHGFLIWYLKIYQTKLDNIPLSDGVGRADHNAGKWGGEDPIDSEGSDLETLNVSQDALLRVTVKGWFDSGNPSDRGDVCMDMDGDGDEAGSPPGEPYPAVVLEGCADPDDQLLAGGHWVLPDDLPILASPFPGLTRQTWDVMSDIDDDIVNSGAIGPKSTLDTHDAVPRPWVPCIEYDEGLETWVVCDSRKTVDPDQEITVADALMPPLKIRALIADPLDAGFLKQADKDHDVGLDNLYQEIMIPASPEIPWVGSNCGYDWNGWVLGPYEFHHVFNYPVNLLEDCSTDIPDELCNYDIGNQADQSTSDITHPRIIEFYTDNRGLGYFFANGDYNLDFSECSTQALTGMPDCSVGDMVGWSTIQVIGDYPYCRKHPSVLSNPVDKVWEWGGYKDVDYERIDATHLKVMVNLVDRDGYCKYDVDVDDDTIDVIFSPSEHPVQGEEIGFFLNTEVGSIIDVSPNALYDPPAPHGSLQEATVAGYEDGVIVNPSEAVALAEDARVLAGDESAPAECTAWIVIEHPPGEDPNVSIIFHDPEGDIIRHWPLPALTVSLVPGWNDVCYVGPEQPIEDAVADIAGDIAAIYRIRNDLQIWQRWIPDRPELSTMTTFYPYDQLFVLVTASADWPQEITALPSSVDLALGWNSVCYVGDDKATEEATADIAGDLSILLSYGSDQMWRRYMPGLDWANNITTLNQFTSVLMLVTAGTTWAFDPPATPAGAIAAQLSLRAGDQPGSTLFSPLENSVEYCGPVFPGTYYGTVTVGGQPAPDGTTIWAIIDGIVWAGATTSGGRYVFEVPESMPVTAPCFAGGELTFQADGASCQQSPQWAAGPHDLNLTCGQPPSEVTVRVDQGISIEALGVGEPGLSAFTINATYDPSALTFSECTADPGGSFDMALCTPEYEPNVVRASGIEAECGLTGDVPLATIEFDPTPPVCPDDLLVNVETLADCDGGDILRNVDQKWWVGDADRDFDKDAVDALFMLQYVVKMRDGSDQCPPPSGDIHLPSADADCDGDVDAVDALFVLQHVVGLRPVLCPAEPLKVGTLFDYTGDLAEFGPPVRNGADLAASHVNSAGGVLGQVLQLIHRDSEMSGEIAVGEAHTLVDLYGVPAIIGALASGVTLPVAEDVTIPKQVILISPASTSPAISALDDSD
jgi:hypothetical protein